MLIIRSDTQDMIAKYFADLSKTIWAVGLATYFFNNMPLWLRIGFFILALVFFAVSVILMEKKGK